mmetsp:Transcript_13483/g.24798  ORF Transcript_13483/g.24798 Transcript_13483/m.24798 type:complete len:295 (+) Transcript_13483:3421-4305(+)
MKPEIQEAHVKDHGGPTVNIGQVAIPPSDDGVVVAYRHGGSEHVLALGNIGEQKALLSVLLGGVVPRKDVGLASHRLPDGIQKFSGACRIVPSHGCDVALEQWQHIHRVGRLRLVVEGDTPPVASVAVPVHGPFDLHFAQAQIILQSLPNFGRRRLVRQSPRVNVLSSFPWQVARYADPKFRSQRSVAGSNPSQVQGRVAKGPELLLGPGASDPTSECHLLADDDCAVGHAHTGSKHVMRLQVRGHKLLPQHVLGRSEAAAIVNVAATAVLQLGQTLIIPGVDSDIIRQARADH